MINTYKRKLQAILEYIEKDDSVDKDIYESILEINKTNYLSLIELKSILGTGATDEFLKQNDIFHIIVPDKNLFKFQVLIGLKDGLISMPCFAIEDEDEWELDIHNVKTMKHKDLREIKDFIEDILSSFSSLVKNYEVKLITEDLGGKLEGENRTQDK